MLLLPLLLGLAPACSMPKTIAASAWHRCSMLSLLQCDAMVMHFAIKNMFAIYSMSPAPWYSVTVAFAIPDAPVCQQIIALQMTGCCNLAYIVI